MDWINVGVKLPQNTKHVWISGGLGMEAEKGYYSHDYYGHLNGAWFDNHGNKKSVLFWQPIPAQVKPDPPK